MQMTQNSGCRGKFSAPPTSRLHVLFKQPPLCPPSFSSSSDSNRTSPSSRRFRKRAALQRSFCTRCTSKRNCFQAHTPATGLARHSFPGGPPKVPARGGTSLPSVTRDVLWGLAPRRGSLAETQRSLHGARCGCSGCPRRRSPCHNRITRVSGHPREKVTRFREPKNKSNRHAVVHQQVGQSRQNQRAQRDSHSKPAQ